MESEVAHIRDVAGLRQPKDAANLFKKGSEHDRITALAAMQGNPPLGTSEIARQAILYSQSAFEQYHGLKLAKVLLDQEPAPEIEARDSLIGAVRQVLKEDIRVKTSTDRKGLAESIIETYG